ncbi:unnamed protein product [Closterium sp. Naga37s-1]|nr:unnamed protein product [Closterium sp. Naga37s-1]
MVSGSRQRLPTAAVPAARNERPDGNDGDAANDRSDRSACSDVNIDDHAIATALQEEYAAAEARSSLEQDRIVPPEPVSKDHAIAAAVQDKYIAAKTKEKSRGESEFQASSQPGALAADSDDHAIAAALQEEEEHLAKETKGKSRGKSASQPSIQTESLAADSDDHAIAAALQEEFLKEAESEAAGSGATGSGSWLGGAEDWLRGLFPTLPGRGEGGTGSLSRRDAPGHGRAGKGLSPAARRNSPGAGNSLQGRGNSPARGLSPSKGISPKGVSPRGVSPKGVSPARGFSPAKGFQAGKGRSPVRGVSPMRWLSPVVRAREPDRRDAARDPAAPAAAATAAAAAPAAAAVAAVAKGPGVAAVAAGQAAVAHSLAEPNVLSGPSDQSSPSIGPPESQSNPSIGLPEIVSSPSFGPPESQSSPFIAPLQIQSGPSILPPESQSSPWIGPGAAPGPNPLTRSLSDPAEVTLAYSHIQAGNIASPGGYGAGNTLTVSPQDASWVNPSLQSTPIQSPRVSSPEGMLDPPGVRLKSPGVVLKPPGVTCVDDSAGASPAVSGSPDTALPALAPSPDLFAASPPVPNRRLVLQMAEKGREREQGQESERKREQERSLLDPALSPDLFAASPPVPNRRLVLQMAERGREREQEKDREREQEMEQGREQGREQAREQGQEWMSGRQADAAAEQADGFDNNDYDNDDASKGYKDDEGDVGTEQQEEELDGDLALAMELASEELSNAGLRSNEPPTAGRSITRLFTRSNSVLHSMRVNSGRLPSLRESLSSHQTLTERLAVYGLRELPMVGDGNCQFRALADQLFRNANRHAAVRQAVVQQMRAHSERYSPYVPDSFSRYLRHMARNGEWGDHITLQAAADKVSTEQRSISSHPIQETSFSSRSSHAKANPQKSYGSASGRKYTTTPSTVLRACLHLSQKRDTGSARILAHSRASPSFGKGLDSIRAASGQHPRSIRAASAQHRGSIRAASGQHPRSIRAAFGQHSGSIRAAFGQHSGNMPNLGPGSNLEGILKWSLAHSDGTGPARQITDEERQWFNQAMQAAVVDIVQRMKEISMVMAVTEEGLLAQGVTVDEMAGMLEELQEHVESIDMANDLKAIGGLEPLLRFLKSPHAILRARAAEVVTTMVQNNEKSQRSVMEAGGHLTLMDMILNDADVTARTKAVGAISSLVRHNPEGLASLRAVVGIKGLTSLISSAAQPTNDTTTSTDIATSSSTKLLLKALHLTLYFLQQCPSDRPLALSSELLTSLLQPGVVGSQDGDVRLAVLRLLQDLAPDMTVGTAAAAAAGSPAAAAAATDAVSPATDDGERRRKGDEVSETEAVIGARIESVSALQKRQSSGENAGGSGGASEPDSGDLQEELDALLATRRALIGRKVTAARGESGVGGSAGATGAVGGAVVGGAATEEGLQQPLMFLGAP